MNVLLQMKCNYILSNNTIEAQLGAFLSDISGKIDIFVNALGEKVKEFDLGNLPISAEDIGKLIQFVNTQK